MKINFTSRLHTSILALGLAASAGTCLQAQAATHARNPAAATTTTTTTNNYGSGNGTSSSSTTNSDYNSYSSGSASKFALGYRRSASAVPGANMGQLSGQVEFKPGIRAGLDLGFIQDFDAFLINAELQYDFVNRGAASLFFEGDLGFYHTDGGTKAFIPAALLGFNYQLTSQLQLSVAYGLQMGFGTGTAGNHVAITNAGDFAGNFAVRWMF